MVPHEPQDLANASPFQGFTPGILNNAQIFRRIATLPRDVTELVSGREGLLLQRVFRGGYSVLPMQIEVVRPFLQQVGAGFCCIWSSTLELAAQVQRVLDDWKYPILHITPSGAGFGCADADVSRERLRDYVVEVLEYWERTGQQTLAAQSLRSSIEDPDDCVIVPIGLSSSNHLVTVPNEVALVSSGCQLAAGTDEPLVGLDNEPYLAAIRDSVAAVRSQRELVLSAHQQLRGLVPYDTILTAPSMFKAFDSYKKRLARGVPESKRKMLLELLRQLALRGTYNFLEKGQGPLSRAFMSPEGQALNRIRREELLAYTAALAVRASSNMVPVIRLPPSVNLLRQELTHLGTVARGNSPHRERKMSDLARKLSEKLVSGIPEWIIDELRASEGVKLVADAPLEWFPVDGVPLALRVDCSRIATTPGDLFLQNMVAVPEVVLTAAEFDEILVVRSFAPEDPLRRKVTQAIEIVSKHMEGNRPRVRFVDVQTEDDLVAALNAFEGALMVYDGHGVQRSDSDVGMLRLPAGDVDAWELRGRARVPPIVILSACDTHPFDASHATTANGFLAAGAQTVLGTSLPVNANHAAVFIGRLLLRIAEYMPLLLERPHRSLRWSELLPGLQRRQYCTEALLAIDGKDGILLGHTGRFRVNHDVGMAIDSGERDWFETMLRRVSEETGVPEDRVRRGIQREAYLTDALLYVQLGSPERLIVVDLSAFRQAAGSTNTMRTSPS